MEESVSLEDHKRFRTDHLTHSVGGVCVGGGQILGLSTFPLWISGEQANPSLLMARCLAPPLTTDLHRLLFKSK